MGGMFYKSESINQDLSTWSVSNVSGTLPPVNASACNDFSTGTTSWTLPKPNFTNCDPN